MAIDSDERRAISRSRPNPIVYWQKYARSPGICFNYKGIAPDSSQMTSVAPKSTKSLECCPACLPSMPKPQTTRASVAPFNSLPTARNPALSRPSPRLLYTRRPESLVVGEIAERNRTDSAIVGKLPRGGGILHGGKAVGIDLSREGKGAHVPARKSESVVVTDQKEAC